MAPNFRVIPVTPQIRPAANSSGGAVQSTLGVSSARLVVPGVGDTAIGTVINEAKVTNTLLMACKTAFVAWKTTARFFGVVINGATAVGPHGCLIGSDMRSLISAQLIALKGDELLIANGAADGIAKNFEWWRRNITVPALPWYPALAAVSWPGPAPLIRNVPTPLLALTSSELPRLTSALALQTAMQLGVGRTGGDVLVAKGESIFSSVALELAAFFATLIAGTMVSGALGSGPVPGFSLGVTAAPVVGGSVLPIGGVLV